MMPSVWMCALDFLLQAHLPPSSSIAVPIGDWLYNLVKPWSRDNIVHSGISGHVVGGGGGSLVSVFSSSSSSGVVDEVVGPFCVPS